MRHTVTEVGAVKEIVTATVTCIKYQYNIKYFKIIYNIKYF